MNTITIQGKPNYGINEFVSKMVLVPELEIIELQSKSNLFVLGEVQAYLEEHPEENTNGCIFRFRSTPEAHENTIVIAQNNNYIIAEMARNKCWLVSDQCWFEKTAFMKEFLEELIDYTEQGGLETQPDHWSVYIRTPEEITESELELDRMRIVGRQYENPIPTIPTR